MRNLILVIKAILHLDASECDGGCGTTLYGYGLCVDCEDQMRALNMIAIRNEATMLDALDAFTRPNLGNAIARGWVTADGWDATDGEVPGWVARAQRNELPVYTTHSSAYAYGDR